MSSESCESRLDEVLAGYLDADPGARGPVRQDLLRRYPDLAEDLQSFFADHDRMLLVASPVRQLLAGHRRGAGMGEVALPTPGLRVGAYELLEELGRGGMGVVYKARHAELGRVVALKMILTGPWASPAEIRRLRAEAEAVAALDHPNIVPLYEVGEHDGQPYFTMKLIEGTTLSARASKVRHDLRAAAALVATLARAVHHAHERGILHRDLKPANVLLDDDSQPHLTDFGLARRLGITGSTQTGVTVGTPSYVAPEQAAGHQHAVTIAADVYGLGAILYELLTGGPPFRGATSLDVLRQLMEAEPVRPSVVNPKVSRDLETICLKCLEKEPAKRYATALDLAADLDAFLSGEPIRARPVGGVERFARWCRRKPVVAGLAVALGASLLVGFTATFVQWRRAERHLEELETERAREEESFQQAHRAVHEFGGLLGEELSHVPGMQGLRKKSLELTRAYLEDFLRRQGDVSALRSELAEARLRLAGVMGELDANAAARDEARKALGLYEELLHAKPDDPILRRQQATAQSLIARLEAQQGESAAALEGYHRAAAGYAEVARDLPNDVEVRAGLARIANNVGSLHHGAGRRKEALEEWGKASKLYEQLTREVPARVRFRLGLAQVLHNLGVLYSDENRHAEALTATQRSCDLQRDLVKEYPQSLDFRHGQGVALHHLAMLLGTAGKKAESRAAHQEALDLRERLARENPTVVAYQLALAASYMSQGAVRVQEGRSADALASYRRAAEILKEQARRDPTRAQTRLDLLRNYFSTGYELARTRHRPKAIEAYQSACEVGTKLVESSPEYLDAREQLVLALNNLGLLQGEEGRHDEARASVRRAVEQARHLVAAAPGVPRYRQQLGGTFSALGKVERDAGRLPAAVEAIRERLNVWPANGRELIATAAELSRTAAAVGRGKAALSADEGRQRLTYLEFALGALRQGLAAGYGDFARLRKAPELVALRKHPGFEETLREFERRR